MTKSRTEFLRNYFGNVVSFPTPQHMINAAVDYFTWVEENPMIEVKIFNGASGIRTHDASHPRAMSWQGLAAHTGVSVSTWKSYKDRPEFAEAYDAISAVMYTQKFENAAAGLLDARIITRDLGLADKVETENKTEHVVKTFDLSKLDDKDLADLARILGKL